MTRTWKVFSLQTILAAALVAAPFTTFEAKAVEKINGTKELAKKIETLETDIKNLKESVVNINEKLLKLDEQTSSIEKALGNIEKGLREAMGRVKEDMGKVNKTLEELKGNKKNGSAEGEDPDDIKGRLARIEKILDRLGPNVRIRRYPPPSDTGRILLTNNYDEEMDFIINGVRYRLAPGASRVLEDQPAGTFRYEVVSPVWGLRARKTAATLLPNATYRLIAE